MQGFPIRVSEYYFCSLPYGNTAFISTVVGSFLLYIAKSLPWGEEKNKPLYERCKALVEREIGNIIIETHAIICVIAII